MSAFAPSTQRPATNAPHPDSEVAAERALLERAQAGDSQAAGELLMRYEGPLLRYSQRMCGHPQDAEDVLQDSLLSAVRNLDGFRGDAKLSTWLFTIVRSYCLKKRRRGKFAPRHVQSLTEAPAIPDGAAEPESTLAGREVQAAIGEAIQALSEDNREIVLLRDVEGLSAAEVADVLGMGVGQVKSRLHRARVAVRRHISDRMSREDLGLSPGTRDRSTPPMAPAPPIAGGGHDVPATACPDIAVAFSRLLEEDISAETCDRLQSHVDGCKACQQVCDGMKQALSFCRTLPAPSIPAPLQAQIREAIREELRACQARTESSTRE